MLRQDLDGDGAVEPRVAGLIDLSLSPSPDRGEDFMSAEFIAWLERHITGEVQFSQSENGLRLVDGVSGSYFAGDPGQKSYWRKFPGSLL